MWYYLIGCADPVAGTWYSLRIQIHTDRTIGVAIETGPADVELLAPEVTVPGTADPGVWFRARFTSDSGQLLGKLWPDGGAEPDWQVFAFSDIYPSGLIGVRALRGAANTNPLAAARWGLARVRNPQRMTVVRSTNGIVKAQPAGADVRLTQPAIVAL
jgi:hypothetical protein